MPSIQYAHPGARALPLSASLPPSLTHPPWPHRLRTLPVHASLLLPGIPLSTFCGSRAAAAAALLLVYPAACAWTAVWLALLQISPRPHVPHPPGSLLYRIAACFAELLLAPGTWFASWRAHCVLAAWHAAATAGGPAAAGYALEDKGAFLDCAAGLGLPITPVLQEPMTIFVKHRAQEGGLGVWRFR